MDDHTRQENFIPARAGLLAGKTMPQIVAEHFGVPVNDIIYVSMRMDHCHLGWFVDALRVKLDG